MIVKIFPDYSSLSRYTADLIADVIRKKPTALICIASGHTPVGVFEALVSDVKNNKLDISACTFISLDEWLGIPPSQPGSCRHMMDKDFFLPLHIPESQIVFFDGLSKNPESECDRINTFISRHGGLDVMLVGIGLNGHIAMNEPGTPDNLYAHVADLAEETKAVGQKYFAEQTSLSQGLTLGLRHFKESGLPILMANGSRKAPIIKTTLESAPSAEIPASVIHVTPHAVVVLDREASGT